MREDQQVEFKREYTEDIKREAVAFLNSNDGMILIGVDDNGKAVGVENADEVMRRVSQALVNGVRPDCSQFFRVDGYEDDGKTIVRVNIVRGTNTPYYLGDKGIRPNGVYVRIGSMTAPAQESVIRDLVKRADGDDYESKIAYRQDLTFTAAEKVFAENDIAFGEAQKTTLGVVTPNGYYTDLGLLLSDQCEHSIKCAIFEGTTKEIFKGRREFGGSLLAQVNDVYGYIDVYNKTSSHIVGKQRADSRDYPPAAVREALLNAVVHRDYSYSGSTLVNLYDDRLEILSLGDIPNGMTEETLRLGVSQPRNKRLADVFYRLRYIEAYGTGIPRIFELYAASPSKPVINAGNGVFVVALPNMTYVKQEPVFSDGHESRIMNYLSSHDGVSKEEAAELIGTGVQRAYGILRGMAERGLLYVTRTGNKHIYRRR